MNTNVSPTTQKMIVGAALFAAWSYLVYTGKVPATDYVENIKIGLGGLGLYHVTQAIKGGKSDSASADSPAPVAPTAAPTTIVVDK